MLHNRAKEDFGVGERYIGTAGNDFKAGGNHAVRARRWLASAHRLAGAKLLHLTPKESATSGFNHAPAMTPDTVISLAQRAVEVTLLISAPPLLAALVTGLVVSIFQAATQINEMTLSFIPKLVAIFVVLVVFGPWMLSIMIGYINDLITGIPGMIG